MRRTRCCYRRASSDRTPMPPGAARARSGPDTAADMSETVDIGVGPAGIEPAGPTPSARRRLRSGHRAPVSLTVVGALVALAALSPAAYLLLRAGFSFSLLRDQLAAPTTVPLIYNTLWLLLLVLGASLILGVGLAVLIARTTIPWPRLWTVLLTLPLGVPTFVGSYAWVAFSYRYFPGSTLIFGRGGAAAVLTVTLFPYIFLPVLTAVRRLDPAQEEASRALGRGPVTAFFRVTLPQLRSAIATGVLIIGLHILAEFGAVEMLSYSTLTTAIVQRATVLGMPESARALAVVLALGAIILLLLDRVLRGKPLATHSGRGAVRPPIRWRLGWTAPLFVLVVLAVVLAALAVPLWVTVTGLARRLGGAGGARD